MNFHLKISNPSLWYGKAKVFTPFMIIQPMASHTFLRCTQCEIFLYKSLETLETLPLNVMLR